MSDRRGQVAGEPHPGGTLGFIVRMTRLEEPPLEIGSPPDATGVDLTVLVSSRCR